MATTTEESVQRRFSVLRVPNLLVLAALLVEWPRWQLPTWVSQALLTTDLVLAGVAVDALLLIRRGQRMTLAVALADATAVAAAIAVGILFPLGLFGDYVAMIFVAVVWTACWCRALALAGQWEGPVLITLLQVGCLYIAHRRPFVPTSEGWQWAAAVFSVTTVGAVTATLMTARRAAAGRAADVHPSDGGSRCHRTPDVERSVVLARHHDAEQAQEWTSGRNLPRAELRTGVSSAHGCCSDGWVHGATRAGWRGVDQSTDGSPARDRPQGGPADRRGPLLPRAVAAE